GTDDERRVQDQFSSSCGHRCRTVNCSRHDRAARSHDRRVRRRRISERSTRREGNLHVRFHPAWLGRHFRRARDNAFAAITVPPTYILIPVRRTRMRSRIVSRVGLCLFVALTAASLAFAQWNTSTPPPPHQKQAPAVEKNLEIFDTLDFDVFSNQKWDRLAESHAEDIIVTWPDGHETKGIAQHIKDLSAMFVYAPD